MKYDYSLFQGKFRGPYLFHKGEILRTWTTLNCIFSNLIFIAMSENAHLKMCS
jgi:hypothetical protein